MKIQLLLATGDHDYAEHLHTVLAKDQADIFELGLCSSPETLGVMLQNRTYDICLLEPVQDVHYDFEHVRLPLLLRGQNTIIPEELRDVHCIKKYQRISTLVSEILMAYSESVKTATVPGEGHAHTTAVWSPAGGVGKTSTALAYAAAASKDEKTVVYFSLESFSSLHAFMQDEGKSISFVLEQMDRNPAMQMRGIRQKDPATGVFYYGAPENYDDLNILGRTEIAELLNAAATGVDEVVVDLPAFCDARIQCALELADQVLLVSDQSAVAQQKIEVFMSQNNTYDKIRNKVVIVNNKGTRGEADSVHGCISLPLVQSADPAQVVRTLSASQFKQTP